MFVRDVMKKRARSGTAQRGKGHEKAADSRRGKPKAPRVLAPFERAARIAAGAVKSMDAATEAAAEASRLSLPFDRAVAQLRTDDGKVRNLVPAVDPIRDLARELRRQGLGHQITKLRPISADGKVAWTTIPTAKNTGKKQHDLVERAMKENRFGTDRAIEHLLERMPEGDDKLKKRANLRTNYFRWKRQAKKKEKKN